MEPIRTRKTIAALLAAALVFSAPGFPCYQALGQEFEAKAPQASEMTGPAVLNMAQMDIFPALSAGTISSDILQSTRGLDVLGPAENPAAPRIPSVAPAEPAEFSSRPAVGGKDSALSLETQGIVGAENNQVPGVLEESAGNKTASAPPRRASYVRAERMMENMARYFRLTAVSAVLTSKLILPAKVAPGAKNLPEISPSKISLSAPEPQKPENNGGLPAITPAEKTAGAQEAAESEYVPSSKIVADLLKLAKTDPAAAFDRLSDILTSGKEHRTEVRASAMRLSDQYPVEKSAPVWIDVLKGSSNWYLKRMAAKRLGNHAVDLKSSRADIEQTLRGAYADKNASLRLMAGWALRQMGVDPGPEIIPAPPEPASSKAKKRQVNKSDSAPKDVPFMQSKLKMRAVDAVFVLMGLGAILWLASLVLTNIHVLTVLSMLAMPVLPLLIIAAVFGLPYLWRGLKAAGRGIKNAYANIGPAQDKKDANSKKDPEALGFKDVAGADDAIREVRQIVEYLKNPERFKKLGGEMPRGILFEGPPGTGKTLIAQAIAGEANAHFLHASASDFVEKYVGVGASRVRELFQKARKQQPAIIFIDEIDAIGRKRGSSSDGGAQEHDQTLNALLTEMNGFDEKDDIVVIGATNRKDVLDPALLRPGRFDIKIYIGNPDILGREAILAVHGAKKRFGPDVDLEFVAKRTAGIAGAGMANIANVSALQAAMRNAGEIGGQDLQRAVDKETFGDRRHLYLSEELKQRVAYHESGHALAGMLAGQAGGKAPHKITIIPHGGAALGYAEPAQESEADTYLLTKDQMMTRIIGAMGGRAAEEIMYQGDKGLSTGPGSDIQDHADRYARNMVEKLGMSEKVGILDAGSDPWGRRKISDRTAYSVDQEVSRIIGDCLKKAKELLAANQDKLEAMAKILFERETIYQNEIEDIVYGKKQPAGVR
ncbi:MAG: AAA family ATPase [Elusimicrobiota bacterium]